MLVLLPPSETKHPGGDGAPLDLAVLTTPELTPLRAELADALVELAADVPAARTALGLSPAQDDEITRKQADLERRKKSILDDFRRNIVTPIDCGKYKPKDGSSSGCGCDGTPTPTPTPTPGPTEQS